MNIRDWVWEIEYKRLSIRDVYKRLNIRDEHKR